MKLQILILPLCSYFTVIKSQNSADFFKFLNTYSDTSSPINSGTYEQMPIGLDTGYYRESVRKSKNGQNNRKIISNNEFFDMRPNSPDYDALKFAGLDIPLFEYDHDHQNRIVVHPSEFPTQIIRLKKGIVLHVDHMVNSMVNMQESTNLLVSSMTKYTLPSVVHRSRDFYASIDKLKEVQDKYKKLNGHFMIPDPSLQIGKPGYLDVLDATKVARHHLDLMLQSLNYPLNSRPDINGEVKIVFSRLMDVFYHQDEIAYHSAMILERRTQAEFLKLGISFLPSVNLDYVPYSKGE